MQACAILHDAVPAREAALCLKSMPAAVSPLVSLSAVESNSRRLDMYVVNIAYSPPLERIDDALEAHRQFLARHFEAGVFIAAGPKIPRDGGIILASSIDCERLDAILATHPFVVQKLARYEVIEFKATRLAPGLNPPIPE
jgi:uncharacterized protein YciI